MVSELITWLTVNYIGNITANAVYDVGVWTAEQARQWLRQHWFDPVTFEEIRSELQKSFSRSWQDVEQKYRQGGQWSRLSKEQQDLIHGRSEWLDSRERQARIFPQVTNPKTYAAGAEGSNVLVADHAAANAALLKHLESLGILDGLPRDFERLLEEHLLNGLLYHFVDGIKRDENLRNVLFFHQAVGLQVGQKVIQAQLDLVVSQLEQRGEYRVWQGEIINVIQEVNLKIDRLESGQERLPYQVSQQLSPHFEELDKGLAQILQRLPPENAQTLKKRLDPMYYLVDMLYNQEELRMLCIDLEVGFDDLSGQTKQAKARELVLWMNRWGRFSELLNKVQEDRPKIFRRPDLTDNTTAAAREYWLALEASIEMAKVDDATGRTNIESAFHLSTTSLQEITECTNAVTSLTRALTKNLKQSKAEKLSIGQRIIEEALPDVQGVGDKIKKIWSQVEDSMALHFLKFAKGVNDVIPRYHRAWNDYEKGMRILLQNSRGQSLIQVQDNTKEYLNSLSVMWGAGLSSQTKLEEFPTDNLKLGRAIQRAIQANDEYLKLLENGMAFIMTVAQYSPDATTI